ncbi:LysR family transcriptional regulator [Sinosporangium siamense]|uniref:LysR family transcriptional regulator n=1 Tax=Sinosporangium siamense TaxID=1367973 RepID=A0A919V368_9ACTN|nr:LysR family transcriptional regulator [Sinosporangium siamense]GII90660.1 LysR family transcriptional regulator [Sinosporangium siamense]
MQIRLTLRQLELFSALPAHETLASAAAALSMSESALSHAVTELERAVGEQLCIRRKARGFSLTPAGRHVAERARRIIHDADAIAGDLAGADGELRGPAHLGCYTGLGPTIVPPLLDGFPRIHPAVEIAVTVGPNDEILPALESGRLDIAVVYDMDLPPKLQQLPVYRTEVVALLPADHPLAGQPAVELRSLADDPFILLDSVPSTANTYRIFRELGINPRITTSMPTLELVRALVGRGLGYSLVMSRPNQSPVSVEGRHIVERPLSPRAGKTSVVAVWPEHLALSRRARTLAEYAAAGLSKGRTE